MCGRFSLAYPRSVLLYWYCASAMPDIESRYNTSPTTDILVIRGGESGRMGSIMRWDLIPYWTKDTRKLPLLGGAFQASVIARKTREPQNGPIEQIC